jgi:hypothetical protein
MPSILTRLIGGDLATLTADPLGEFGRRSRLGGVVPLKIGLTRGHLVSDPTLVRRAADIVEEAFRTNRPVLAGR